MAYEQRENSGALFKNKKKEKPNQPDYTGNCMVNGKLMQMAAWIKDGQKGKFMSLSFSEPQTKEQIGNKAVQDLTNMNDDIPPF